jgi:predicted DCC family thiol-disulfide oxidoreductase YuxK
MAGLPRPARAALKPAIPERYSYRADKAVPAFDDRGPIVFMDGHCALCTRAARIISRLDRAGEFRICPVQSPLGRAVLEHYRLDPDDPESWLYLADGHAYRSMDAIIRSGTRLGGWGRLAQIFRILPRSARDWLYRRIARNRYSIGGRTDMCAVPDPALKRRLMT